jgi:hypothetical protein
MALGVPGISSLFDFSASLSVPEAARSDHGFPRRLLLSGVPLSC